MCCDEKTILSEIIYALIITVVFGSVFALTDGEIKHRLLSPEAFETTPCDGVCLVELKRVEIYNDRLYGPEDFADEKQEAAAEKPDYAHYLTYRFFVNTTKGESYGFFSSKSDYAMNVYADGALIAATCGDEGYTGDEFCSVCGARLSKGEIIQPTGEHQTELRGAKAATATEDGYTGDEVCTVCHQTVRTGKVIPATGAPVQQGGKIHGDACFCYDFTGDSLAANIVRFLCAFLNFVVTMRAALGV